jgi:hypothetical protein
MCCLEVDIDARLRHECHFKKIEYEILLRYCQWVKHHHHAPRVRPRLIVGMVGIYR